jgi:hypothetical protein
MQELREEGIRIIRFPGRIPRDQSRKERERHSKRLPVSSQTEIGPSSPRRSSTRAKKTVRTTFFDVCVAGAGDMMDGDYTELVPVIPGGI